MNRRLVWIAVVALSISAACGLVAVLTSAAGFIGSDYRSWAATATGCGAMPWAKKSGSGEPRTADLEWSGSDTVKIDIPARVYYQPGPKPQASVSGAPEIVSHVRMRDGVLTWDTTIDCFQADDLVVRLSGPAVTAWTLNGSGELQLSDLKQDSLRITMHGSGTVSAGGEAHEVSLDAAGSGRADLGKLAAQRTSAQIRGNGQVDLANIKQDVLHITMHGSGIVTASGEAHEVSLDIAGSGRAEMGQLVSDQVNAQIRGSGEVDLAPRQDADISIAGSAVVRLHGAVARIQSHVSGSGQIKQLP